MATEKTTIYGLDPSKYPTRMGEVWKEDEVIKLLASIKKKKSIIDIAKEHNRTIGGIRSYIRKLAADYHFNDKRPIEEIQRFTGLTKEQIEDAIKKREIKNSIKQSKESCKNNNLFVVEEKKITNDAAPSILEVVILLKDIKEKLNILLEKFI